MPANKSKKYFFSIIDLYRYSHSSFLVTGPHPRSVPGHALTIPPEYFMPFVSLKSSRPHFSMAAEHTVS
jgi:hypothetical protein